MANKVRISYKKDELLGRGRYGAVFKGELVTEKGIKVASCSQTGSKRRAAVLRKTTSKEIKTGARGQRIS